ncbi:csn2 COP9 signalosome complex subunit 2 [Candida maltosa Xu316]
MSDEEFYSEESYEFEFEDEDEDQDLNDGDEANDENDENTSIDNKYYTAKGYKDDDVETAVSHFKKIIEIIDTSDSIESEDYDYIFKSYKQLMKLYFNQNNYDSVILLLRDLFKINKFIDKSYFEDSLSKMILRYSNESNNLKFVNDFYTVLLDNCEASNSRLWLRINVNLLTLKIDNKNFDEVPSLLDNIYKKLKDCLDSIQKSFTLQVIASEIDYLSKTNNLDLPRMSQLYRMSLKITTAVTHPKILAVIKECGGKVQFYRENFEKSRIEFYESFKSYDEAGSPLKYKLLKYVALCSLLTESELDPFESQETQTVSKSPEFDDLKLFIHSYNSLNLDEFLRVFQKDDSFYDDDIFIQASKKILVNLQLKSLLNYIKGYTSVRFEFICQKLKITESEMEGLLLQLTNSGKLKHSKIDFINKVIFTSDTIVKRVQFPQTSTKDIYYNIKLLECLSTKPQINKQFNEDIMDVDEGPNIPATTDYFHQYFFPVDRPSKSKDWYSSIEAWYLFLISSIPQSNKDQMSQKDQILNLQKVNNVTATSTTGAASNTTKVENELANFNTGLLNSTVSIEDHEDDTDVDKINKVDVLNAWYKEAKEYLFVNTL